MAKAKFKRGQSKEGQTRLNAKTMVVTISLNLHGVEIN